jgi:hypothetical protein
MTFNRDAGPHSDWRDEAELVGKLSATQLGQLERNRHKVHWRAEDVTLDYLIRRLHEEVGELVENPTSWEEAADVANFAAMIADRADS